MTQKEKIQDLTQTVCLTGVLLCVLAVILKELAVDKQVDWVDIIAGVAGGIASFALYIPKDWLL